MNTLEFFKKLSRHSATSGPPKPPQPEHQASPGGAGGQLQRSPAVDVVIRFIGGQCHWQISGALPQGAGPIHIEKRAMRRLIVDSCRSSSAGHEVLYQLGHDFYAYLIADPIHSGLELALYSCTHPPGSLEGVRFCFHLDQENSALCVETLAKPPFDDADYAYSDVEFLALHAPLFRQAIHHPQRYPLFKDRHSRESPVACLIIQGEADSFSAGGALARQFHRMPSAPQESAWLMHYFSGKPGLVKTTLMRPEDYQLGQYGAAVREVLSRDKWQLIHFIGHSAIGADDRAWLALGGEPDDLLDIAEFAARARHAQFMFLNSCATANGEVIRRLAEAGLPAVAGYACPIDDQAAQAFAKKFYVDLIPEQDREGCARGFLEYAFMRARHYLYEQDSQHSAWASPRLYLQSAYCEPDPIHSHS